MLLVTKRKAGPVGLRLDKQAYAEVLWRAGASVEEMELPRHTPGELERMGAADRRQRALADGLLRERLARCAAVVGFEFLGDARAWGAIRDYLNTTFDVAYAPVFSVAWDSSPRTLISDPYGDFGYPWGAR